MRERKTLEDQKNALKEKMNQEIDRYYDKFSQSDKKITIDTIETIMAESQGKMRELINGAASEIVESAQTDSKKNSVPTAKGQ